MSPISDEKTSQFDDKLISKSWYMEILREKDRELYDKLVRLAGGDSAIVIKCLSSRKRAYVTLRDLIEEIQIARPVLR